MATIIKNGKKWRVQVCRQGITKTATFTTRTEAVNWANFIEAEKSQIHQFQKNLKT